MVSSTAGSLTTLAQMSFVPAPLSSSNDGNFCSERSLPFWPSFLPPFSPSKPAHDIENICFESLSLSLSWMFNYFIHTYVSKQNHSDPNITRTCTNTITRIRTHTHASARMHTHTPLTYTPLYWRYLLQCISVHSPLYHITSVMFLKMSKEARPQYEFS